MKRVQPWCFLGPGGVSAIERSLLRRDASSCGRARGIARNDSGRDGGTSAAVRTFMPIVEPETRLSRFASAEEMPTVVPHRGRPLPSWRAPIPFPRMIELPVPPPSSTLWDRDGPLVAAGVLVVVLLATAVVYVARTPARLDPTTRDALVARTQGSSTPAPPAIPASARLPLPDPSAVSQLRVPPPPPTTTEPGPSDPPTPPPPPRRKAHRAARTTPP